MRALSRPTVQVAREESVSLLKNELQSSDEDLQGTGCPPESQAKGSSTSKWLSIILLSLVLVDVSIFLYIANLLMVEDYSPLRIGNTYVGLSDLYEVAKVGNTSTYKPIENRPRVDAQVSLSEPNRVFPVDRLRWMAFIGRISPPDLRLRVTNDIHTITQFRVIDYGMERCQLAVRLPPRDAQLPEPFSFPSAAESIHLNVCKLDAPAELNALTLSYNTRPRCIKEVGTLVVRPGEEATLPEFPCRWAEHHAFEISCVNGSKECLLDVRATQDDTWGVFMYQHQTI